MCECVHVSVCERERERMHAEESAPKQHWLLTIDCVGCGCWKRKREMFTGETKSSLSPVPQWGGEVFRREEGTGSRWRDAPNLLALTSSLSLNETNKKRITVRERGREGEQEGLRAQVPWRICSSSHPLFHLPRDPQDSQQVKSRALRLIRLLGHQTGTPEENFTKTCNTPTSWKRIKNNLQHSPAPGTELGGTFWPAPAAWRLDGVLIWGGHLESEG